MMTIIIIQYLDYHGNTDTHHRDVLNMIFWKDEGIGNQALSVRGFIEPSKPV